MQATIIIAYYRKLQNLELILMALNNQWAKDFEVIIAEDDQNPETAEFLEKNKHRFSFQMVHLYQNQDLGFRKNNMLNKAISHSSGEILIFIDGDCIPHKYFVMQYIKNVEQGFIFYGRRLMLGQKTSAELLKNKSISKLNFISLLFSDSKKLKEGFYFPFFSLTFKKRSLLGCNWGIFKKYLVAVNGFDEDYVHAGVGEDVDIEWRLTANGLKMKSMKNKAVLYHLYHAKTYSEEDVQNNYVLLGQKKQANKIQCLNGIKKLPD